MSDQPVNPHLEDAALIAELKSILGCDQVRLSSPSGETVFVVAGQRRSNRELGSPWTKNGAPIDFGFMHEICVASGSTPEEMLAETRRYMQLSGRSWADTDGG